MPRKSKELEYHLLPASIRPTQDETKTIKKIDLFAPASITQDETKTIKKIDLIDLGDILIKSSIEVGSFLTNLATSFIGEANETVLGSIAVANDLYEDACEKGGECTSESPPVFTASQTSETDPGTGAGKGNEYYHDVASFKRFHERLNQQKRAAIEDIDKILEKHDKSETERQKTPIVNKPPCENQKANMDVSPRSELVKETMCYFEKELKRNLNKLFLDGSEGGLEGDFKDKNCLLESKVIKHTNKHLNTDMDDDAEVDLRTIQGTKDAICLESIANNKPPKDDSKVEMNEIKPVKVLENTPATNIETEKRKYYKTNELSRLKIKSHSVPPQIRKKSQYFNSQNFSSFRNASQKDNKTQQSNGKMKKIGILKPFTPPCTEITRNRRLTALNAS